MRKIDVSKPGKLSRTTVLSYGPSRTGKTRFSASWPRPLFLSDATESGWTTIQNMDRNVFFEPDRVPDVWAIEKVVDMTQAIHDAEPLIKRGEVQTLVIDSLTFYSDLFFNFLERQGGRVDQRQLYMKLAAHLKEIREQVHLTGANVIWLCLAKDPGEDQPVGGPMLSGQNAQKFAAGCDYMFYHRSIQAKAADPLTWEVRTRKFGQYAAGGRDEGRLPDPLGYYRASETEGGNDIFVADCTFRTFAESLGILEVGAPASDYRLDLTGTSSAAARATPVAVASPPPGVVPTNAPTAPNNAPIKPNNPNRPQPPPNTTASNQPTRR